MSDDERTKLLSRRKKVVFALICFTAGMLAVEVFCRGVLWLRDGTLTVTRLPDTFAYADGMRYRNSPSSNLYYSARYGRADVDRLVTDADGFIVTGEDFDRVVNRKKGGFRIAVFGGSTLAGYGATDNTTTISSRLESTLRTETGRDIEVINCGVGGYSIEQELLFLMLYILPYEPDLVVTIDGVNNGYNPTFPQDPRVPRSDWHDWQDQGLVSLSAPLIHYLISRRMETITLLVDFMVTPNNYYRTPEVLFRVSNSLAHKGGAWGRIRQAIWRRSPPALQAPDSASPPEVHQVEAVRTSSYFRTLRLFSEVCRAQGVRYLAVMQPHPGYAKVLGERERSIPTAYLDHYANWVGALDAQEAWARGEIFGDSGHARLLNLTRLFANVSADRYVDACHYDDAAQAQIAERVARALLDWQL